MLIIGVLCNYFGLVNIDVYMVLIGGGIGVMLLLLMVL